jgi:hypothetical protein
MREMSGIKSALLECAAKTEQAAREIYYAKKLLGLHHPAHANLNLALEQLEVTSPSDVGLSTKVKYFKEEREYYDVSFARQYLEP